MVNGDVTAYGHPPECHVSFGRGDVILFVKIPVSAIKLLKDYSNVPWHTIAREADWQFALQQNIYTKSQPYSYELWDKTP